MRAQNNRSTHHSQVHADAKPAHEEPDCKPEKIFLSDGAIKYIFHHGTQEGERTVYTVFPGVEFLYHSIHTDCCPLTAEYKNDSIAIHHCRAGRIERQNPDDFFHLMPGDFSVAVRECPFEQYCFPIHEYQGISILIASEIASKNLSCYLEDINVQPDQVVKRLCKDQNRLVIRSPNSMERIFSELYSLPENCRQGYLKIKTMELFLALNEMDPAKNRVDMRALPRSQVVLARKIAAYLIEKVNQHMTVAELSRQFRVSQTYLQNSFKKVYGVPIYSFLRLQKMQAAAKQLIHTERTVLEIANDYGYDNASKFSSAFREVMGESPREYRKRHKRTDCEYIETHRK